MLNEEKHGEGGGEKGEGEKRRRERVGEIK